jgi:hypothetical protein
VHQKIKETAAMEISKDDPVVATGEIEAAAYMEIIWDVMAGIDRWPRLAILWSAY